MDPTLLPLDPRFLNAAAVPFTVIVVRILSGQLELTKTGKIAAVVLIPALIVCALELAGYGLGWQFAPLVYIVATLSSVGAWSLGKNVGEASRGGS